MGPVGLGRWEVKPTDRLDSAFRGGGFPAGPFVWNRFAGSGRPGRTLPQILSHWFFVRGCGCSLPGFGVFCGNRGSRLAGRTLPFLFSLLGS